MRRVLVVSPRFPPVNAADMHRVRQSLPYFMEFGWEPTVLAVEPEQCDAPCDALLERTVPDRVRVIRTSAISRSLAARIGVGSFDLRAIPFLGIAGGKLLARERFDLIYFSTTAFSVLALGPRWQSRFGVPFVVDLQDPWLTDYYDRPGAPEPPGGRWKYRLTQRLARRLEPQVMQNAAHVISVSPAYPQVLAGRYPWLEAERFTVLPFGAPAADLEVLDDQPVAQRVFDPSDGMRHWVYVGVAGEIMRYSLRAFFLAVRSVRQKEPERVERWRFHFIGTDYAPPERARKTVQPIADECGVGDLVEERTGRIPYFEALQCLRDADVLIVPGSDDPAYTASKLYPYVLARKPLFAVFHENSSVVDVLRATNGGTAVTFRCGEDVETVAERVEAACFGSDPVAPDTDWEAFEPFTAREMTRKECEIFDRVVSEREGTI